MASTSALSVSNSLFSDVVLAWLFSSIFAKILSSSVILDFNWTFIPFVSDKSNSSSLLVSKSS